MGMMLTSRIRGLLSNRDIGYNKSETYLAWLMVSPWVVGFVIFTAIPMLASLVISFMDWDLLSTPQWVGLENYNKLFFEDPLPIHSLKVTLFFTAASIPLNIVFGLAIAMLLNTNIKGMSVFRTIYYMPAILSGVAVALMWRWIFSSDFGLINAGLNLIGIQGPAWLADQIWVLPSFIIMRLWAVGGGMVIYLAGLQSIPTDLYEAAEIDGANWFRRVRHLTLPLLSPTIFFQVITGVIFSMQIFTEAFIMTNGGPANASLFFMLYLYRQGFQNFKMGYASALAWVLFVVILLATLILFYTARFWVYYEVDSDRS